jgi:hypothetical protein
MPRWPGQAESSSRYTALVAFIATRQEERVTLTFAEIESIISVPLSVSAQVIPTIWSNQSSRLGRDLAAVGWRSRLRVREHAGEFWRIS